jgi:probable HAF family extracellular repeat protein
MQRRQCGARGDPRRGKNTAPGAQRICSAGLNGAGHVSGRHIGSSGVRPLIIGPNGVGMRNIGTLGGNYSNASGINSAERVVGDAGTKKGAAYHAFVTGADGYGMTDLCTLPR